jgi:hypothetical protein
MKLIYLKWFPIYFNKVFLTEKRHFLEELLLKTFDKRRLCKKYNNKQNKRSFHVFIFKCHRRVST